MTKKEYLSQAYNLNRRIELKEKRIDTLRSSIGSVSINPDEVKVKTELHSPFETMLLIVIDLEEEVNKDKEELEKLKLKIWQVIHSIGNDRLEGVLELRYLAFKSWEEIAKEFNYSNSYVFTLHREGLELIKVD